MAFYLVTGGAGFIGSHLVDSLVKADHNVRILDDFSTGRRANVNPAAELIIGSVTEGDALTRALEGVDGCFHLAAVASVQRSIQDWTGTHLTNLTATVQLFDILARRKGSAVPVVYASSAAVYGDNQQCPLDEQSDCRPVTAYGADKLGCELHGRVAAYVHGVPNIGLRFFNVYGPRQDPGSPYSGVISIFASKLLCNEQLTVWGDGRQTRDFIYVADVIRALEAAMLSAQASPTARRFCVCTGIPTNILELAEKLGRVMEVDPTLALGPARVGDIRNSVGNPEALIRELGFHPVTTLEIGLQETVRWLRDQQFVSGAILTA